MKRCSAILVNKKMLINQNEMPCPINHISKDSSLLMSRTDEYVEEYTHFGEQYAIIK